jgi:streptogramin lyase
MTHENEAQWLRSTFDQIADAAVVDEHHGRADAWRALRRRTRRRAQRRGGLATLVVVALFVGAFVVRSVGSSNSVKTVHPSPSPTSSSSSTAPPGAGSIVATIDGVWPPDPIAYDGQAVWLARESLTSSPFVVIERRDPNSGRLLGRIDVHQEAVFSIAVDPSGSIWIAGGGDGGVPETTISRIDAKTQHVVFTHTLTSACSCQVVAGAGAVWLGANGGDTVLRVDAQTGAVVTVITLPRPALALAVIGDRVEAGLTDARVAVIDPATNTVERVLVSPDQAPGLPIVVQTPRTTWIRDPANPRILVERR